MTDIVMQRENETKRVVLNGSRTDDGTLCTLVAIGKVDGSWEFYPHGAGQLGVRLSKEGAVKVAREILASAE